MTVRRVVSALAAVAALAACAVVLSRLGLGHLLAAASPGWAAAAFALNCVSLVSRAASWLGMLRAALPHCRVGAFGVVRATMIGVMGSALVPARAGEPARAWLVARRLGGAGHLATVVGTLVSQTLLNLLALAVLALIALLGAGLPHWHAPSATLVIAPVGVIVAVLTGAHVVRSGWAAGQLTAMRAGLDVFRPPLRGLGIATWQLVAWALQWLAAYALLRALHLHVPAPLVTAAALLLAVNVTAVIPVTPSNVGIFQGACLAVLAARGVSTAPALAYGVLLQATEIATAVALGVPALVTEGGAPSRRRVT